MSTPQDPARRLKQKRRRETQLAKWRATEAAKPADAKAAAKAGKPSKAVAGAKA